MSHKLISRSPDLKQLRDEGYDVEIRDGYLLLKNVPYVNAKKEINSGTLVSKLTLANDVTTKPDNHVVFFAGEYPCHQDGSAITKMQCDGLEHLGITDLVVNYTFSAKPTNGGYEDYYAKMTTYAAILSGPAQAIDPNVTAKTFPIIEAKEDESVFKYIDTASSRSEIIVVTRKLELSKIAIIGLGGTGSYVLDLVAKTPVKEIHLFDGDKFLQHNAFRSPGAPSGDELGERLHKTTYFERLYSKMRRGIFGHEVYIDATNVDQLQGMYFVFLCLDRGGAKRLIVEKLEEYVIPFVDVGMGVDMTDESLGGILRVTTSTPEQRKHVWEKNRIPFPDSDGKNDYDRNIQIADLNALNAALAVIKWKKLFGFYRDIDHEHFSTYTIDGNMLINEDKS
jgi:hypothetical protein